MSGHALELSGDVVDVVRRTADLAPKVDVWIAHGLRKRWRVVSLGHTYGEWDELTDAAAFLALLVAGNPDLVELR